MGDLSEDAELLGGFLDECAEMLADAASNLERLQQGGDTTELVAAIFRSVHSIKGNSPFFGFLGMQRLAHRVEDVLDALRKGRVAAQPPVVAAVVEGVDLLARMVERLRQQGPEIDDPAALEAYLERLARQADAGGSLDEAVARVRAMLPQLDSAAAAALRDLLAQLGRAAAPASAPGPQAAAAPSDAALEPQDAAPRAAGSADESAERRGSESLRRSLRVDESAIDHLLEQAGELVVVGDMLRHLRSGVESSGAPEHLRRQARQVDDAFGAVSTRLQKAVMGVRQVQARSLLRKVPRLVREVGQSIGKRVQAVLAGEDLAIDKSHLEILDAPLTHLVRNACDHGIESPERRSASGKDAVGTISISVRDEGADLVLEVADDGGGLNLERIRAKGESAGLIAPGQAMDETAILRCLCSSGFSTAERVTDISGRGVGMDAVMRAVDAAGGRLGVRHAPGLGTAFQVRLPRAVSTQILSGYFVRCGPEVFVLPLDAVEAAVAAADHQRHEVPGRGVFVTHQGRVLPLLDLAAHLAVPAAAAPVVHLVVRTQDGGLVIGVEAVLGIKTMVKLPLDAVPGAGHHFTGAAMMGDGAVGLLLDLNGLTVS